jgi:quinoprotein glucose dehydrogenase
VFAQGFNTVVTGVGAGIVTRDGTAWFTCAPQLWRLHADGSRDALLDGFGVHIVSSGHDMHGLRFGPDGRLYWTIGDCGARVQTKEGGLIDVPNSGAVFRANPDGTEMELVHTGLRNPQHLAFNEVGDLFTGDNNGDSGDKARWVHVVEGGNSGWRNGWEMRALSSLEPRLGAWNEEGLWALDVGSTAPHLIPPVAHIGHGPAGICYYPGTGLPEQFRDSFFFADFPGGVRYFRCKPKGASYEVENAGPWLEDNSPIERTGKLLWSLGPSDVQFPPGGGVMVLDWGTGWEKPGTGRIYRVHDRTIDNSAIVQETARLLREGFTQRNEKDLAALLGHSDQRVRLGAQFALVEKNAAPALAAIASSDAPRLARLHAVWGLGQIARRVGRGFEVIALRLADADTEVRAQAVKVLGDSHDPTYVGSLVALLRDADLRVQFFAAQSLGKLHDASATQPLLSLLRTNADRDALVRHAVVVALAACAERADLFHAASDDSDSVRLGVLLAFRRLHDPEVARFLSDKNSLLVIEAARAIYDEPIDSDLSKLAALASAKNPAPAFWRRAHNAAYLIGSMDNAAALATEGASGDSAKEELRALDALDALAKWNSNRQIDRVLGTYRTFPPGRIDDLNLALRDSLDALRTALGHRSQRVRLAALRVVANAKLTGAESEVTRLLTDDVGEIRAAALRALAALGSTRLRAAVEAGLDSSDKVFREAARKLMVQIVPERAVGEFEKVLATGSVVERQETLGSLATLPGKDADRLLAAQLDALADGRLPESIALDLLEAAARRSNGTIRAKVASLESKRKGNDPLAAWRECLNGGDVKRGELVFSEHAAGCMRCHKINNVGGDVGPDLRAVGLRMTREQILTAIVDPNASIAPGYENVLIEKTGGELLAGILTHETPDEISLKNLENGAAITVKQTEIKKRTRNPSPMTPDLAVLLGKRNLRDLVEYLAELRK